MLKESPLNPRLVGGGLASPQRKQRKVSDWAKKKNFSFKKSRDEMLKKKSSSYVEELGDYQKSPDERRISRSFIDSTK